MILKSFIRMQSYAYIRRQQTYFVVQTTIVSLKRLSDIFLEICI